MRILDVFLLSWRQLKERRLRSVLTILAVAVGVATIVALSAQVEGVSTTVIESLGKLGPDTIIVSVRGMTPFNDADVARLRGLEGVLKVTPVFIMNVRASGLQDQATLVGVSSVDLVDFLGDIKISQGSVFYDVPAPQALIGYNIAFDEAGQELYRPGQPLLVQIGQRPLMLTVVGVLDSYGAPMIQAVQPDNAIFIPIEYVGNLVRGGRYTVMIVKAVDTDSVDQVSELIGYVFGGRATVTSVKYITETVIRITSQINLLVLGIAGTSFIAAGLGTLNIMMISVLERVREIGIFKALGMKDRGVLSLYMIQGLLIGLLGSLVGIGFGYALTYLIPSILGSFGGFGMGPARTGAATSLYTPIVSPLYVSIATATSVAITLLSSAYPAWRASRLRPVEALRYE